MHPENSLGKYCPLSLKLKKRNAVFRHLTSISGLYFDEYTNRICGEGSSYILDKLAKVTQFTGNEKYDKWLKLKKCYSVFNELRCMSGVYYNPDNNLVESFEGDEVLQGIAKERKFYGAYTTHGEPRMNSLERIFAYKIPMMPVPAVIEVPQPIEPPVMLQNNHQVASTSTPTTEFANITHSFPSVADDNFWADLSGYDQ